MNLRFASLFTLGVLSSFIFFIILLASYVAGFINGYFLIIATIVINIILWLVSPYVSTWIYKWLYKAKFYKVGELENKKFAAFLTKICQDNNLKVPLIGLIPDDNPTAFTFGSGAFNARVVVTEGLFKYLTQEEVEAVVAHEVGHIKHRDFIVMSIASTMLQILYELYFILVRSGSKNSSSKKSGNYLALIGIGAFVLYIVGQYVVLYLSRVREYYADEFAARYTKKPDVMSSALIKVAYGIMATEDDRKAKRLLESTKTLGVMDYKGAKDLSLIHATFKDRFELLEQALLFDIVSPWAKILELKSTHPLVGKRIKRLSSIARSINVSTIYDFEKIKRKKVDKAKLYHGFFRDVSIYFLPFLLSIVGVITPILLSLPWPTFIFGGIIGLGLGSLSKTMYAYPNTKATNETILSTMTDVYASPLRGRPVSYTGKVIGRGIPGFIFSEDMMFQDKTGLMFLNYESFIPFFGNLFFAWKRAKGLQNVPSKATGWFLRGATHHLELKELSTSTDRIKSSIKFWKMFGSILLLLIGTGGFFIFSSILVL